LGRDIKLSYSLLLPHKFKIIGWVLLIPGILLSVVRFYFEYKPSFLEFRVFAVYSSYFETNYFKTIENNYSEEISGILLLLSLFFITFSKEKREDHKVYLIRLRALFYSVYLNTFLLLFSILFVFGIGFINVLILNLFSTLIIFLIIFKCNLYHSRKYLKGKK
jgi:hypothetical protein